ncbi:hypothetical protein AVEN_238856-1 [Araneus ventricosus]|uniref:Uncharacterized protein n=1 Tax=Araneus ventricosus TaxID=182803 RepID=A0A4Y2EP56_ARAVE|nr:hypothetical protein AVEN_238856-1 [Araneus ventricosus]
MSAKEFISIDDDILTEVPIDSVNDIIQRHTNNDSSDDDDESILIKCNVYVRVCVSAMSRRIYRTYSHEIWHTGSRNDDSMHLEAGILKFNLEFFYLMICVVLGDFSH